jgi:3-isopropylmalate/(R)-2-methylmalate dehydratase small subunit
MKPVITIRGTMVPLPRTDIDTDQIIPQQYLKRIERTGYGEFLFDSWARSPGGDPIDGFVLNNSARRPAKVLVAGPNFGCGSSREHAVWAIQDWGFGAVVASSFADIFRNNAVNIGLLPVELGPPSHHALLDLAASPDAEVTIDLETQSVIADGIEARFNIDPESKRRLLNGLDAIGETLLLSDRISIQEQDRPTWMPQTRELAR